MIFGAIFPGRYLQGKNALEQLGPEIGRLANSCFCILSPFTEKNIWPGIEAGVKNHVDVTVGSFNRECSDEEIERISGLVRAAGSEAVVGIGGGKTLDTAKAVAHELGLKKIVVPTLASTDAPTSASSVIYTPQGEFKRYLPQTRNPDLVLVDTQVVANAPSGFLISGMGDALATWFEAESCRMGYKVNSTGFHGLRSAYALADLCYKTLLEYGAFALESCKIHRVTPALEHVVEANTLLSGLGFESGGLAAAHAIHNGLTALEETHDNMHGEKVAFGVQVSLFLNDQPIDLVGEVYDFCEVVGLPTTLGEIGLGEASDEDLMKAARAACAAGETIHNELRPVSPDRIVEAMRLADSVGRNRKE